MNSLFFADNTRPIVILLRKDVMNPVTLIKLSRVLGPYIYFGVIARKGHSRLKRTNKLLTEEVLAAHRRTMYMAAILDRHGIELDEFDVIAITQA